MKTNFIMYVTVGTLCVALYTGCGKKDSPPVTSTTDVTPSLPETPPDFPTSGNDNLASLGRVLFYDKQLSANDNIACASCHQQENAFCDSRQFSPGTDHQLGNRNAPSIFNRQGRMFWDGRAASMKDLSMRPIKNPIEMNMPNLKELASKLSHIDYYQPLIKKAFNGKTEMDSSMLKDALTEFLVNFNFSNNKFSQSQKGQVQLTQDEQIGKDIFFSKGQCFQCHHVAGEGNFPGTPPPSGYGNADFSHNIGLDQTYADPGVGGITKNQKDIGAFMLPVLLNIEYTAPYMHDGRFATLEEVVEHYSTEIEPHANLSRFLRQNGDVNGAPLRLNFTSSEKKGLVAFLKTLSDPSVLNDTRFSNPFVSKK
jgi:cytochrome c peroxidase